MITKTLLKEEVRQELLQRILDRRLKPGARVNESALASELGVSRTPLREALAGLAQEGFVRTEPNRGFLVTELEAEEAIELFHLVGGLEGLALRLSGVPDRASIEELRRLNGELRQSGKTPERMLNIDVAFHAALVARCTNRRLMSLIEVTRRQSRRYEFAFMGSAMDVEASAREHDEIVRLLEAGEIGRASELVYQNLLIGLDRLVAWLNDGRAGD